MNKEPKFYRAILEDERARRASTAGGGGTDYGCDIEVLSFPQANCAQILKEYSKKRDDFGIRSQMCVVYVKEHFHMYILKNGHMLTYLYTCILVGAHIMGSNIHVTMFSQTSPQFSK